jgi:hypothetical protein
LLLRDLADLPTDQREALVLAELHDNSHAEVAEIIGCEREKVKSLVFQARTSLLKSREAREISCLEVQRQLSVLRGGSLRRSVLRRHLKDCAGCRHYHEEVKRQRAAIAAILPVVPSAGLKFGAATAIAAAGGSSAVSGLAAGGGAAAGAGAGASAGGGSLTAIAAKLGASGAALKGTAAVVAVTAVAGGAAGVEVAVHRAHHDPRPAAISHPAPATRESRSIRSTASGPGPAATSRGRGSHEGTSRNREGRHEGRFGEHGRRGEDSSRESLLMGRKGSESNDLSIGRERQGSRSGRQGEDIGQRGPSRLERDRRAGLERRRGLERGRQSGRQDTKPPPEEQVPAAPDSSDSSG